MGGGKNQCIINGLMFRKVLIDRLQKEPNIKILLLESVCTDQKVKEIYILSCITDECDQIYIYV